MKNWRTITSALMLSILILPGLAYAKSKAKIHLGHHRNITETTVQDFKLSDLMAESSKGTRDDYDFTVSDLCYEGDPEDVMDLLMVPLTEHKKEKASIEAWDVQGTTLSMDIRWKSNDSPFLLGIPQCQ